MAGSLGTVYAEIRLQMDKFKQDVAQANDTIKSLQQGAATDPMTQAGAGLKAAGAGMTKYVTAPIIAMGTAAVYTGMKFDQAMAGVKSVAGATGGEFEKLREQARQLGRDTQFSATDAANGMKLLAQAGFSTNEVMTAMPNLLSLAAAGGLDLGTAAQVMAATMNAFGEEANQTGRYADVYAQAAATTATDVYSLGEAMSYGAPAAAAMGYSLEETAAIMATFSNAGIDGTRAGTTFEAMMRDLKKKALDSGGALKYTTMEGKKMSIAWYDAQGNTRDFTAILADMEGQLAGATEAEKAFAINQLTTTAGQRGLNIMMQEGSAGLGELTKSLENSGGAGEEMASTLRNTLAGSMEELKSSWEEVMIGFSDILAPIVRTMAVALKNLANWFGKLSPEMKTVILIVLGIVAVIGPLLMFFGMLMMMVPAMVAGFGIVSTAVGAFVLPVLAVIAAIIAVVLIAKYLIKNWDKIKIAAGQLGEAIGKAVTAIIEWFKQLPGKIGAFLTKAWTAISTWGQGIWDGMVTWVGEAVTAVVTWFQELPGKIGTALSNAWTAVKTWVSDTWDALVTGIGNAITATLDWFAELPNRIAYWLGYALGRIVRFGIDSWTNMTTWIAQTVEDVATWFSTLPERIGLWLTTTITNIIAWGTNLWTQMTTWVQTTIDAVVLWFAGLPAKISLWLTTTITNVTIWGTQLWTTMTTWVTTAITNVVAWFAGLPAKIWLWLTTVITNIVTWGTNLWTSMKTAATSALDGFMSIITGIPGKVSEIFTNIVSSITGSAGKLWTGAKSAASSLWNGFKDGLGIHSPSYLEVAMQNIMDKTGEMRQTMGLEFSKLTAGNLVPPSATLVGQRMFSGLGTEPMAGSLGVNGVAQPAAGAAGPGGMSIVINNPVPEKSEDSVRKSMLKLRHLGVGM